MDELGRVDAEGYRAAAKKRITLVLDDVRSRHNVGSIFRTADGFGLEGIVLCGFTPCPPHREIEKTALGATASVPWSHEADILGTIRRLKSEGYTVIALEQTEQARALSDWRPDGITPIAVVLGNELNGVSDAVIEACDTCVVIPQHGTKHSLNVSVCAGIVCWWLAGGAP
jgi:23S rRNA (guanosine2251-2'-O)-methyltransferase